MTTATLTADDKAQLAKQVTALKGLAAELSMADRLTEGELETLKGNTHEALLEFENYFASQGPVPIRPEVPKEARTLYVKLWRLIG